VIRCLQLHRRGSVRLPGTRRVRQKTDKRYERNEYPQATFHCISVSFLLLSGWIAF